MPPRWLRWLIGMFWVSTMGWLFWHDLWPSLRPGEPPPFHIDDVEEVLKKSGSQKTTWLVQRQIGEKQPVPVFLASTWIDYQKESDTYTLKSRLTAIKKGNEDARIIKGLTIELMTSDYSVDRAGRLLSLNAEVKAQSKSQSLLRDLFPILDKLRGRKANNASENNSTSPPVHLRISGDVRGNQFFAHCHAEVEGISTKPIELNLPPTTVSQTASVLMPLHPVSQIIGLRLGQRWHQPLVDPLRDAFPGLSNSVRSLNAQILPQPEMLPWDESETSCYVIEYTSDENEVMGRTWVEQASNRVLQQEVIQEDGRWSMKREPDRSVNRRKTSLMAPPQLGTNND